MSKPPVSLDIQDYFKKNWDYEDPSYGQQCRCSVTLNDGLYLPCVILQKATPRVDLALRRFEQEKHRDNTSDKPEGSYEKIVRNFVTAGTTIDTYKIQTITDSPYVLPKDFIEKITGEIIMGWAAWVFEMSDGAVFSYGSQFSFHFFQLPEGYSFSDVNEVHDQAYVDKEGMVKSINADLEDYIKKLETDDLAPVYRERPYFTCYLD